MWTNGHVLLAVFLDVDVISLDECYHVINESNVEHRLIPECDERDITIRKYFIDKKILNVKTLMGW